MPLTQEQIETLTINRNSSEQTDQTQNIAYEVKSLEETINIMCIHAERLKRLYKCADEMNNECDSQKISDAIAHARANRVEPNVDLKKKKDKNLNSCINHALKYDEYRESIINKGGTSGTLFKDFFRVFKNTRKSHVKEMSNSLFMDDFKDDYSQAFESEPNPLKFLLKLQYALENKEDILPKIIERNQQIEMLKQERDKQILIRHYGVTDMANDSTVYADYFREGSKLGSSGHRMLSYTNKDGEIVTVGKSKNKVHEDYIKTRKEMEEKVKGADLKSFLKPNDIAEYIAFDPSSFVKSFASSDPGNTLQAAAASTPSTSAPSAQTPITVDTTEDSIGEHGFLYEKILGNLELVETGISAINGQFVTKELNSVFKNMDSENIISDKTISELTGNQTVKGFTKEDFQKSNLGDTYLSGSENVIYGKEYKKDGTSTDLTISKSDLKTQLNVEAGVDTAGAVFTLATVGKDINDIKDTHKKISHAENTGDTTEAERLKAEVVQQYTELLGKLVNLGAKIAVIVNKFQVSAGTEALSAIKSVTDVASNIGNVVTIVTGCVGIITNAIKGAGYRHDEENARNAANSISKMNNIDEKMKKKALITMNTAKRTANANKINSGIDSIASATKAVGGAVAFIPGVGAVATAIGLAATLGSMLSKMIVSKVFKNKAANDAWATLLGYGDGNEFKAAKEKIGCALHRDGPFDDIIRRQTGVASANHFVDALNITNAIDIYTSAHAYQKADKNTKPLIRTTLTGLGYSNKSKYKNIQLTDILKKVGFEGDWKGTLRKSLTDSINTNIMDEMNRGAHNKALSGVYDQKRKA